MTITDWQDRKVLVTGGASFIASDLNGNSAQRVAQDRYVDDLIIGEMNRLHEHTCACSLAFKGAGPGERCVPCCTVERVDIVFRSATGHGGP